MKYLPLLFILFLISCSNPPKKNENQAVVKNTIRSQEDYKKIDFHTHYRYDRAWLVQLLKKWNMQTVIVDVPKEDLEQNKIEVIPEFSTIGTLIALLIAAGAIVFVVNRKKS